MIRFLLLCVCLLSAWAPLFLVFTALNAFNPMQVGFLTTFVVQNDSGQQIDVWPLGAPGPFEPRVLPLFITRFPALPDPSSGRFRIPPGGTATIRYDWDDTNFTELLIRSADGRYKRMPVDTDREPGCCSPPGSDVYVVPRMEVLMNAPDSSLGAVGIWRLFGGQSVVLAFCFLCIGSWRVRGRLNRGLRPNQSAA